MEKQLLISREVDRLLRYPLGQTMRLARAGLIPFIRLPDEEIRFDEAAIDKLLKDGANKQSSGRRVVQTQDHNRGDAEVGHV